MSGSTKSGFAQGDKSHRRVRERDDLRVITAFENDTREEHDDVHNPAFSASMVRRKHYPWLVVGLLWFCGFFNYADRQAVNSVFPLLSQEFLSLVHPARHAGFGLHVGLRVRLALRRLVRRSAFAAEAHLPWACLLESRLRGDRSVENLRPVALLPGGRGPGRIVLFSRLDVVSGRLSWASHPLAGPGNSSDERLRGHGRSRGAGRVLGEGYGWRWPFYVLGLAGTAYSLFLGVGLVEPVRGQSELAKPALDQPARRR